jgi:hypothetical protein
MNHKQRLARQNDANLAPRGPLSAVLVATLRAFDEW